MIKPLRQRHLQIWLILSALLPVGIISSWLVVPQPVKDKLLQPTATTALPLILKKLSQNDPSVFIRTNADTSALQLEWINTKELTYPSVLIYQVKDSNSNIESGGIVGRIDVRGTYHFPLKKETTINDFHFFVYDIIHHKVIQRINL